jgi:hypothetical protein
MIVQMIFLIDIITPIESKLLNNFFVCIVYLPTRLNQI